MKPVNRFLLAPLLLLIALSAFAFPRPPEQAFLDVSPSIPSAKDHITVAVYDMTESGVQGWGPIENVVVARTGNTIQITANLGSIGLDGMPHGPGVVDLGTLPPGRYIVEYASPSGIFPDKHKASVSFSVSDTGVATAVEYYNQLRDHYFLTASPDEIAKLDNGTIEGWTRTGEGFPVLPVDTMPSNANPVCRFYGLPEAGLDSHFFSDQLSECEAVKQKWPSKWLEESPAVFGTPLFVGTSSCQPVYRLYNNRSDANHRYTTSAQARDQMIARGWILEGRYGGYGDVVLFAMCVPAQVR